jgi:hypothetical protein
MFKNKPAIAKGRWQFSVGQPGYQDTIVSFQGLSDQDDLFDHDICSN